MPMTKKGTKVMKSMVKTYGAKKGKKVFYASKQAGKITGVDKGFYGHMNPMGFKKVSILGGQDTGFYGHMSPPKMKKTPMVGGQSWVV